MFRPIPENLRHATHQRQEILGHEVQFTFDGRRIAARDGDTVAAALLANGIQTFREAPGSGEPRGPYCLMGVCFECLVVIDGVGNRQACLMPVRDGMVVETQHGAREVDALEGQSR